MHIDETPGSVDEAARAVEKGRPAVDLGSELRKNSLRKRKRRGTIWPDSSSGFLSFVSLCALIFQNSALVLLMKHSYRNEAHHYSTPSVVAISESLKFFLCLLYVVRNRGHNCAIDAILTVSRQPHLALPCILYMLQNNLLFLAVHSLPVSTYVVCSQGKVLTSAFFSYILLGTHLDKRRILALAFLTIGMVSMQVPSNRGDNVVQPGESGRLVGLLCVFLANLTSGFAGVFLEKIYKSDTTSSASVWVKNMQLALLSAPLACIAALIKDREVFRSVGFFHGYDEIVIGIVILQAAGGLIVAVVMRYASTILKCFAISISICLCALVSIASGEESLTSHTIVGIILVNLATVLYGFNFQRSSHFVIMNQRVS